MRTSASFTALVTLMAAASVTAAPIAILNGSSTRTIGRVHGDVRSRFAVPVAESFQRGDQDMSYTVNAPNAKCRECREDQVNEISTDGTQSMGDVNDRLNDMNYKVLSNGVQVPNVDDDSEPGAGFPYSHTDVSVDTGDKGPDDDSHTDGPQTRPETQPETRPEPQPEPQPQTQPQKQTQGSSDNDGDDDGDLTGVFVGQPGSSRHGKGRVSPYLDDVHNEGTNDNEDLHDEGDEAVAAAKNESKGAIADAHAVHDDTMPKVISANDDLFNSSDELNDGVKDESMTTYDDVHHVEDQSMDEMNNASKDIYDELKADAQAGRDATQGLGGTHKKTGGNGNTPGSTLPTVQEVPGQIEDSTKDAGDQAIDDSGLSSHQSQKQNPDEDCEDDITVENKEGKPSVSTSIVRRFSSRILPRV